jgi:hypothetical protein
MAKNDGVTISWEDWTNPFYTIKKFSSERPSPTTDGNNNTLPYI